MFSQSKPTSIHEAPTEEMIDKTMDSSLSEESEFVASEVVENVAELKYAQLQDQYTRLAADFENFRKRSREEQDALLKYGAQNTMQALLPVLDNLERAAASLSEKSEPQMLYKSFQLVYKQLTDGLGTLGLQKVASIGVPFDPQTHEAVNRMPSNDIPENSVLYESQSGYTLHDKLLRPAQVVVSTGSDLDS
jgi:molecular chaperone GrpE